MKFSRPFVLQALVVVSGFLAIVSYSSPVWSQTPTAIKTKVNAKDGLTYVWIPPGVFRMGCSPHDPKCRDTENRRTQ